MNFKNGVKDSIPIVMGYFPVSFTFGLLALGKGLSLFNGTIISITNFTSAGQFAGLNIIFEKGGFIELALVTFIVNIRYTLMAFSLSEKIKDFNIKERLLIGFGITDEIFAVSSLKKGKIKFSYMIGLIVPPYLSWILGTFTGGLFSNLISDRLSNSMGIALYGMFLAIIVPEGRRSKNILVIILLSVALSCLMFKFIPQGWSIIISTVISSLIGAVLFSKGDEKIE